MQSERGTVWRRPAGTGEAGTGEGMVRGPSGQRGEAHLGTIGTHVAKLKEGK